MANNHWQPQLFFLPTASIPHIPDIKCTGITPTGSSIFKAAVAPPVATVNAAAIAPIISASQGLQSVHIPGIYIHIS